MTDEMHPIDHEAPSEFDLEVLAAEFAKTALESYGAPIQPIVSFINRVTARQEALAAVDKSPVATLLERHHVQYPYACTFGEARLIIDEGVFCPTFTNVSPFLLGNIPLGPDQRVLDAFSGSGAFGINAALHGAKEVVAFDISARAVACAKKNAVNNSVGARFDARLGTIDCIGKNETFDLIIANPPLLPGEPATDLESAVLDRGLQATIDFIRRLPRHLAPKGSCYLLTSDIVDRCGLDIAKVCRRLGLAVSTVAQANLGYESYRVHRIRIRQPYKMMIALAGPIE